MYGTSINSANHERTNQQLYKIRTQTWEIKKYPLLCHHPGLALKFILRKCVGDHVTNNPYHRAYILLSFSNFCFYVNMFSFYKNGRFHCSKVLSQSAMNSFLSSPYPTTNVTNRIKNDMTIQNLNLIIFMSWRISKTR